MSTASPDVSETVFDDNSLRVARSYAEAIVNVATKTNDVESVVSELEEIDRDLRVVDRRLYSFLGSTSVPAEAKSRVLEEGLGGRASATVVRFLHVLNAHGRLGLLEAVAKDARSIWDRKQNRKPVLIQSAVDLDDSQKSAIHEKVARMIGATPILSYQVDASLLGGLVIQVGDELYDASIRTKLSLMKTRLIAGQARALSVSENQVS